MHGSLAALAEQLEGLGGRLDILRGRTIDCIGALIEATDARAVFWNRRYGSAERSIDAALKAHLLQHGRVTESFNASLLHEPWQVKPRSGDYFRVFTPFFKAARLLGDPEKPIDPPATITAAVYPEAAPRRVRLVDLALSPRNPDWSGGLQETWCPGERHAQQRLGLFLNQRIAGYARRTAAVIATRRNIASDGFYPPVHPVADWTNA